MIPLAILPLFAWCFCAGPFPITLAADACVNDSKTEPLPDDEFQKIMIENIKARILWKLGMTEPPDVTKPVVPDFIMRQLVDVDHISSDDADPEEGDDSAEALRKEVIIFPDIINCFMVEEENPSSCFTIQFSEDDTAGTVKSADLWLYIAANSPDMNYTFTVLEESFDSDINESIFLTSIKRYSYNASGWIKFDLGHVVQTWFQQRGRIHNLRVTCMDCDPSLESLLSVEDDKKPVLVVHLVSQDTGVLTRRKRETSCEESCCKKSFRVNFKDIDWDNWIISPPGYNASFCFGSCTASDAVCPESSTSLNTCLNFQLTEELTPETVKSAELWLHTRNSSSDYSYVVSEIKSDAENNGSVKNVLATLHPNSSTWGTIDVGETMRALSQNRNFTFILEVSCVGCRQNVTSPVSTEKNLSPFILVSVYPQSPRSKRTSTCGGETASCSVENFRLSFKDIGWDTWIIQPEAYNANYCRGTCTHDLGLSHHHYTAVIRNYIQVKGENTTARLCCVPDKLSSLYLIYLTLNNTVKLDRIPKMAVESCDCA